MDLFTENAVYLSMTKLSTGMKKYKGISWMSLEC